MEGKFSIVRPRFYGLCHFYAYNVSNICFLVELRNYWEVPAVAHFCSLFRAVFKLIDFDIEVSRLAHFCLSLVVHYPICGFRISKMLLSLIRNRQLKVDVVRSLSMFSRRCYEAV